MPAEARVAAAAWAYARNRRAGAGRLRRRVRSAGLLMSSMSVWMTCCFVGRRAAKIQLRRLSDLFRPRHYIIWMTRSSRDWNRIRLLADILDGNGGYRQPFQQPLCRAEFVTRASEVAYALVLGAENPKLDHAALGRSI